jgi:hypothetical protein
MSACHIDRKDTQLTLFMPVYAIAQAQRAVLPDKTWGSEGRLIASTVGGNLNWALRVNAFVTPSAGKSIYEIIS